MKRISMFAFLLLSIWLIACEKVEDVPPGYMRGPVPAEVHGTWMYGQFSLTEFWSQEPATYLGNAPDTATAFKFQNNGIYEQYVTYSSVVSGITTYHQSVTRGTVVFETASSFRTHPYKRQFRVVRNGVVVEEGTQVPPNMGVGYFNYTSGVESSGSKVLYIAEKGSNPSMAYLQKP
jgi:hypothetical protein